MDDTGYGGLDPELIKLLLATNGDPAKLQDLAGQQAMADKLRQAAFEDHPGTTVGRQYLPDIGGTLAAGLGGMYGKHLDKQASAERDKLFANQADLNNRLIDRLASKPAKIDPLTGMPVKKPEDDYLPGTPSFGDY